MLLILLSSLISFGKSGLSYSRRIVLAHYITDHFSTQLTNPEEKKRRNFSQFGYGLSFFSFPLFPITDFIDPHDFGVHSYGRPDLRERNGALYTCRGGFMDFSHIRVAADWTVYLAFKIITEHKDFDLPAEGGALSLRFKNLGALSIEDIAAMAQKIAFERLEWHELASWHYHMPNYTFNEQQSAFTPEDTYSNLLGTTIGRNIALRILKDREDISYSQIATEEIQKAVAGLAPVDTKKASREAYDIVDRNKQLKLPEAQRNKDVWWDSKIVFSDERYVFKRYTNIGPRLSPWLVPEADKVGCPARQKAEVLYVPQKTRVGVSFYNYFEFRIAPDSALFYSKILHKQLHPPFAPFTTNNMGKVLVQVSKEMEKELSPGFNKRDAKDPVKHYKRVRKVFFK
ncbi:MAG: hypothetical protein JWO03_3347 [Bacteroidetes bacterium]|nr:hypothetical protein [Bacteroidota bacterium]